MSQAEHLDDWTMERLSEGDLSGMELDRAMAHVDECGRCAAELEGHRALVAALGRMPRYAPSDGFSDAVMARVAVVRPSRAAALASRFIPRTRRGRITLAAAAVAPGIPVMAALVWLLTQPWVTVTATAGAVAASARGFASTAIAAVVGLGVESGVFGTADRLLDAAASIPIETVAGAFGVFAIAIPLSAWSLVRLVRTPMRNATYAN